MRVRTRLAAAATATTAAAMLAAVPTVALAQQTDDPTNVDGTFVPGFTGGGTAQEQEAEPAAPAEGAADPDALPHTGGGLALVGGAAVAAAAVLRARRP